MYVSDTGGYGLHRLPLLLLQAGRLAASEGCGDEVLLHLEAGGSCSFSFNGPLWPSRLVPEPPGDSLARLFTLADAGLQAPRPDGTPEPFLLVSPYKDLALVNALASEFEVTLAAGGSTWLQSFRYHRFERELVDYAARLSASALPLHAPWSFEGSHGTTRIRLSLQWCETPGSRVSSWVNQLRASGGTHLKGLIGGIHGALHHHEEPAVAERVLDHVIGRYVARG